MSGSIILSVTIKFPGVGKQWIKVVDGVSVSVCVIDVKAIRELVTEVHATSSTCVCVCAAHVTRK